VKAGAGEVFSGQEKAVIRYTDEVVRKVKASDEAFAAIQSFLDPREIAELTLSICYGRWWQSASRAWQSIRSLRWSLNNLIRKERNLGRSEELDWKGDTRVHLRGGQEQHRGLCDRPSATLTRCFATKSMQRRRGSAGPSPRTHFPTPFAAKKTQLIRNIPQIGARIPQKNLHGEHEIEYFKPLRPGDKISFKIKFIDIFEREGKRSRHNGCLRPGGALLQSE